MKAWLNLLRCGLALVGFFLICEMLVTLGVAGFLWLNSPARLVVRYIPESQSVEVLTPQPRIMPFNDPNTRLAPLPPEAYLTGAASQTAVWANGKAFRSGGLAAWATVTSAWRLWLAGAGTLLGWLVLRYSARKGPPGSQPAEKALARSGV